MTEHDDDEAGAAVIGLTVEADRTVGLDGGFFGVRRMTLRNVRADGGPTPSYLCDFVVRPKGVDAVVVAIFHRREGAIEVLLRDGLRPALAFGRPANELAVPDPRAYLYLTEVVAGIVEHGDHGEEGLRARAAIEVQEETGIAMTADRIVRLGAGMFGSPGAMPERYHLFAVEVDTQTVSAPPAGDGSPMEDSATIRWMELDDAIAACVAGTIEDAKTELVLRRLRDHLHHQQAHTSA